MAIVDDRDRMFFGDGGRGGDDQVGSLGKDGTAIFGRSYTAEPDVLIEQLREDEALAAADTVLITIPSQLGVEFNAHALESIVKYVAPGLGWR